MEKIKYLIVVLYLIGISESQWSDIFDTEPCYEIRPEDRMPLNMDNFVALVETYEQMDYNTELDDMANAILYRYRKNGIIFNPTTYEGSEWSTHQEFEVNKQILDDALISPHILVPEYTYAPREECALHLMVSHSTDLYPHEGVDYMWEEVRVRRSVNSQRFLIPEDERADHPIENGIVQTNSGPIALGTLLAGIVGMGDPYSETKVINLVLGDEDTVKDSMPKEMGDTLVNALYGVTLSGEIAQEALLEVDSSDIHSGPAGIFGNSTTCPRMFSLEENDVAYMTRAEIFASLDALIIASTYKNRGSSTRKLRLSELLRMYYGDHGLFQRDIRACNRIYNYGLLDHDEIKRQALNYIYAYATYFPVHRDEIKRNKDDFEKIEDHYSDLIDDAFAEMESFLKSYTYDDQWAFPCYESSSTDLLAETTADLVVVYNPTGDKSEVQKQAYYIGLTARQIGVGYLRSRVAILDGRDGRWHSAMTNHSNVADWVCNFTSSVRTGGSTSQDSIRILEELSAFYAKVYNGLLSDPEATGNNSQVVMWNLPRSFSENSQEMERAWRIFNLSYPDVNVIFVGSNDNLLTDLMGTDVQVDKDDIFVSNNKETPEEIAMEIVHRIRKSPRMFIYPGCIFGNDSDVSYSEQNHIYTSYVTPNFTTFIRIPPQNYHFSEYLQLSFDDEEIGVCISRTNPTPYRQSNQGDTQCEDGSYEFRFHELCYSKYVNECAPIYIGITGKPDARYFCSDDECVYPNQIEFQMSHVGMICGSYSIAPLPFLYLVLLVAALCWRGETPMRSIP